MNPTDMEEGEVREDGRRVFGFLGGKVHIATLSNAELLRAHIQEGKKANTNEVTDPQGNTVVWVNPEKPAGFKPRFGGGRSASPDVSAKILERVEYLINLIENS